MKREGAARELDARWEAGGGLEQGEKGMVFLEEFGGRD